VCTVGLVSKEHDAELPFKPSHLKHWRLLRDFAQRLDQAQLSRDGQPSSKREATFKDPRRRLSRNDYLTGLNDPDLEEYRENLTLIDGTVWEIFPRVAWAQWRTQNKIQRAVKMELKLNLFRDEPVGARIGPGNTCEKALLRPQLTEGEFYVGDRYYGKDYELLGLLEQMACSYVIRLHDNAVIQSIEELELSEQDRSAGIIQDCWAKVGSRSKGPPRRIVVVVIPGGEEITLVTNKAPEELSAELIARIYRYRWQIELFFKWLKSILGCRHWFAESPEGVAIQIYTALIGALLLSRYCGKKPSKRQMELLQLYFLGYASLEELESMLPLLGPKNEDQSVKKKKC